MWGGRYLWYNVLYSSSFAWQAILETIPDLPVHSNGSPEPGQPVQNAVSGEWRASH